VNSPKNGGLSRRELLRTSGKIAAASAFAGMMIPQVHAAENNSISVALIGCGGRGTGAAGDAMSVKAGPTKLVAMADVFPERLESSFKELKRNYADKVEVSEDRKFIGFDGYKKAIDCLKPGDVAVLTTPPAFRWVQFTYAIEKGVNVFMEKPVAVDGPTARKMFQLGEEAKKKNMKVAVGLMCRHCPARAELFERIVQGELGDILLLRAYRMTGTTASEASVSNKTHKYGDMSELLYQIRRFHSFLWASGGCYSDFLIHNIDECCWMKNAWPVSARAVGGRHYRGDNVDQNFDVYSVEYTFPDGAKLLLEGRTMPGCAQEFASYLHGSKHAATISASGHFPTHACIYKGQNITKKAADKIWTFNKPEPDLYRLEWEHFTEAIRNDKPYSEVERGVEASLVTAMGRMSAHTGQVITRDQMLNCQHEFAPGVDKLTLESPAPLKALSNGKYPVPTPGEKKGQAWHEYYDA
jgi:predicted dehydrogenase